MHLLERRPHFMWRVRDFNVGIRMSWNQDYADVALAVVLTVAVLTFATTHDVRLDFLGVILLLGQTLPLAVRRRWPRLTLLVAGASIAIYSSSGYAEVGGNVGVLVAFYTVAANRPRKDAAMAALLCAGGVFLTLLNYAASAPEAMQQFFNVYLEYVVAWLVGDYVRVRRLYIQGLEDRAQRLEQEREERTRLALLEERSRIARELHDVVAHHVSVMVVQAGGAKRVVDKDPAAAREALGAVEDAGRVALAEMRRMLEVLRAQQPGLAPQPGLAGLERLVAQVRGTGLPVSMSLEGEWRELPAGIDLAAYRIVQEALTNVVKHAGPKATATVIIRFLPACLELVVTDDGRGAVSQLRAEPGGQGLIGMRERVSLYGGQLEVGPVLSGGFRVRAQIPLPPVPAPRVAHPAYTPPKEPPHFEALPPAVAVGSGGPDTSGGPAGSGGSGGPGGSDGPGAAVTTPPEDPDRRTPSDPDGRAPNGSADRERAPGGPVFSPWPEEARP